MGAIKIWEGAITNRIEADDHGSKITNYISISHKKEEFSGGDVILKKIPQYNKTQTGLQYLGKQIIQYFLLYEHN